MLRSALRFSADALAHQKVRADSSQGARGLSQISRAVPLFSNALRSNGAAARIPLVLLVLVMASTIGGIGQSSAHAENTVFTDLSLPTITGSAVEGQTLSEGHATWSSPPAGYAYQWQRCNSAGEACEPISKARTQTYRLVAEDVGFTIRVGESASDAEGAVTPAESEPTAAVLAQAASQHGGGGDGPSGGGGPPVSCCSQPVHVSAAEIKNLLGRQLVPSGKTASILALLKRGGLRMSFKLPEAGTLVVKWYLVPAGAKLKPVAAGQATLTAGKTASVSIKLTAQGRTLLKRSREIHLEATGTFAAKGETAIRATRKFALKR